MLNDHWFDQLNKALIGYTPRRTILQVAGAIASGLLVGSESETEAARNKRKPKNKNRNRHRKKNKKRRRRPKPSCSGGACRRSFSTRADRKYCEFICRQCDGADPREFCLLDGFEPDGSKIAFCCNEGTTCCGNECCGFRDETWDFRCCDGQCLNVSDNDDHCGACNQTCESCEECRQGQCFNLCQLIPGTTCCNRRCTNTDFDNANCGACNDPCDTSVGERCCDGSCVNTRTDPNNCHGCGSQNPQFRCDAGEACCDGQCYDTTQYACCENGPVSYVCAL